MPEQQAANPIPEQPQHEEQMEDDVRALRGMPPAPKRLAGNGERNPEYDRQMLGGDMSHPWLQRAHLGNLPRDLIDSVATAIDEDKNGGISHDELKWYMSKVAKLRTIAAIKKQNSDAFVDTKRALDAADKDGDGLLNPDEAYAYDHNVAKDKGIGGVMSAFQFTDINQDTQLAYDEFLLYQYFIHKPKLHARSTTEETDLSFTSYTNQMKNGFVNEAANFFVMSCDQDKNHLLSRSEMLNSFAHFVERKHGSHTEL